MRLYNPKAARFIDCRCGKQMEGKTLYYAAHYPDKYVCVSCGYVKRSSSKYFVAEVIDILTLPFDIIGEKFYSIFLSPNLNHVYYCSKCKRKRSHVMYKQYETCRHRECKSCGRVVYHDFPHRIIIA